MLRLGFLPSDFNPMLLILGEAAEFRLLAAALRRFAASGAPQRLDRLPGAAASVALELVPADGTPGLHQWAAGDGFAWRLDPATANDFAARAERLAQPDCRAGSDLLTCGGAEDVPVKLSRGEFTEDFLAPPPLAQGSGVRQ
ncbi:MAG: hypothetical protein KGL52_15530 [Rhodospirillales bacterium]|jgi:hypothetical protein|nr:hypothetical protein [Rhodospirillales bacterium]